MHVNNITGSKELNLGGATLLSTTDGTSLFETTEKQRVASIEFSATPGGDQGMPISLSLDTGAFHDIGLNDNEETSFVNDGVSRYIATKSYICYHKLQYGCFDIYSIGNN